MTHYVRFDSRPDAEGQARAICGVLIPERESTALPTCPQCEAYFACEMALDTSVAETRTEPLRFRRAE